MGLKITAEALFGGREGLDQTKIHTALKLKRNDVIWAQHLINKETWARFLLALKDCGGIVLNAGKAPFSGGVLVSMGGKFVIFFARETRRKSNLFVLVTDEDFTEHAKLKNNEIVVPHGDHKKVMGPLLALVRLFNHSSKIQVLKRRLK